MIPATVGFLNQDFEVEEQPSLTYKMNLDAGQIRGQTDGLEAMKQSIYKRLMTERYQYIMYSWNYGFESLDLYGEPVTYVCPELKRRIPEALICDDRIRNVDNFEFEFPKKGVVLVKFTVHTIFGDVIMEIEVNF